MTKEYRYKFESIKRESMITTNGVIAVINHPVGDNSYVNSTVIHLHIKDDDVKSYDVLHSGNNNLNEVEDYTGMSAGVLWCWLTDPYAVDNYGTPENRTAANLYTEHHPLALSSVTGS